MQISPHLHGKHAKFATKHSLLAMPYLTQIFPSKRQKNNTRYKKDKDGVEVHNIFILRNFFLFAQFFLFL